MEWQEGNQGILQRPWQNHDGLKNHLSTDYTCVPLSSSHTRQLLIILDNGILAECLPRCLPVADKVPSNGVNLVNLVEHTSTLHSCHHGRFVYESTQSEQKDCLVSAEDAVLSCWTLRTSQQVSFGELPQRQEYFTDDVCAKKSPLTHLLPVQHLARLFPSIQEPMERHTPAFLLGTKYTSYAVRAAATNGSAIQTHGASVLEVRHLKEDEQGHVLSEGSRRGFFFLLVFSFW